MVSQIGKFFKTAGKIAKQLRSWEPIVAQSGQALTKGQKAANSVFNIMRKTAYTTGITSLVGIGVGSGLGIYGQNTDNKELKQIGAFVGNKSLDIFASTLLGGLLGGPIGALLAAGLSYNTDHSIAGAVTAAISSDTLDGMKNLVAEGRELTYTKIKDILGINSSDDIPPEEKALIDKFINDLKKLCQNGEDWSYIITPNREGLSINHEEQELSIEPNSMLIRTPDGIISHKLKEGVKPEDVVAGYKFDAEFENLRLNGKVGDKLIVPNVEGFRAEYEINGQKITLNPKDEIIKTEEGFTIVKNKRTDNDSNFTKINKSNIATLDEANGFTGFIAEEDLTIKTANDTILVHAGEKFFKEDNQYLVISNENFTIERGADKYNVQQGDLIIYKEDGSIAVKKVFKYTSETATNALAGLEAGKENIAEEDCQIIDRKTGKIYDIKAGETYICDKNGVITVIPKGSQISFRRIGSGAQPLELGVGERYIAEENMKFLVGRNNNLVSVNQGDTLVCKPDSTLDVRRFVPQVQKVSIRKIGTPTPVEYEVGKTYTADKETRLLVGTNNQLVTIKAGQNFKVNADKTVSIVNGN